MKTELKILKDNMITKGLDLADKAKDASIDAINWALEHPYQAVTIASIAVEVVTKAKNAHISSQLMKAEIRSKNAYADKFGER